MKKVIIEKVRGIEKLEFEIPNKGLYVLTGSNGSGKTTLLTALNRIENNRAFDRFKCGRTLKFDTFDESNITYQNDNETVIFHRSNRGWEHNHVPNFTKLSVFMGIASVKFISTTGIRFYQSEPDLLYKKKTRPNLKPASEFIKKALNEILSTDKFVNLKYVQVKSKHGRQRTLHRENKMYVIDDPRSTLYTELNFSLGERLLLNAFEELESVRNGSMLIIDEIELALHPFAQYKFYEYLEKLVKEKNLTCLISTHSRTLISKAKHRIYLENNEGNVSVIDNCSPAYILKDISIESDYMPDFIFFVEDIMARCYLEALVNYILNENKLNTVVKVLEVGGWIQLINFTEQWMRTPPFNGNKIHAFPDFDVKETINNSRRDSNPTPVNLYDKIQKNVHFLDITPDPGVWEWIKNNPKKLESYITSNQSAMSCKLSNVVAEICKDRNDSPNPIQDAKNLLGILCRRLKETENYLNDKMFKELIFKSYVSDKMTDNDFKKKWVAIIMPIINA